MKKTLSLIRASMKSGMNIFKIHTKSKRSNTILPIVIALYLMFMIWGSANTLFEKLEPLGLQFILLPVAVFSISIMTMLEGIYKTGPLIFNCKDDQLLLSLPIKRRTVLFLRIFKFYVFELLFNSLFLVPIMIAYIRWGVSLTWTYYLTSIIMIFFLPIIPIVISCILGVITSSISSRFKYKNAVQVIITTIFLILILYGSYNLDKIFNYLVKHATSLNDLIIKIYYPAGIYSKLITDFNLKDLLVFIIINIAIFTISIILLSKVYFKINSRLKKVTTSKKTKINNLRIATRSQTKSLIRKELNTFFNTPVFIINAGFGLVLFILATISILFKYDTFVNILTDPQTGLSFAKELITKNTSILILFLIAFTGFMTSITSSVISLEGRTINILKSLPIKAKTILMSKIYACMVLTTPIMIIGDLLLFIKLKTNIIEAILLLLLSVIIPLVSHFIGLIVNLKYPKLDAENSTEVVKQSASSFISVMIGMILVILFIIALIRLIKIFSPLLILILSLIVFTIIDILLYVYLINKGTKDYQNLSV